MKRRELTLERGQKVILVTNCNRVEQKMCCEMVTWKKKKYAGDGTQAKQSGHVLVMQ